jgi:hypothetical protein
MRETRKIMPPEIEVIQPDGSSETLPLEDIQAAKSETQDTEPESDTEDEQEIKITLGGETITEPEPEAERAPEWVRDLRKSHRELQRKVREYESREQAAPVQAAIPTLGAKPKLEDHDYDTDRYETALESWYKQKDAVESARRQQQQQAEEQQRTWKSKLDGYAKAKTDLKVRDYEDAEATVQETLNVVQQGVVLQGAENPALVVYALGKNPKKAKELASISDPVKFAFAIAKLESQLKVTATRKPPPPERSAPAGNAPISGTTDSVLERLRVDAERTGDMTKVIAYRRQQREKQSARR